MRINVQFLETPTTILSESEVVVGLVFNSKGGRNRTEAGGTKYWCVVARNGRVAHMFALNKFLDVVGSSSYGASAMVGRMALGNVELPEELGRFDAGRRTTGRGDGSAQAAPSAKIETPREEFHLTSQEKPMSLVEQRRAYLEAASVLIGCHQNLERLREQLAEAEAEHRHWSRHVVQRLGEIVDDGTMSDDGSDSPPLRLQMDGYFVQVQEEWYDYEPHRTHEAVVTGSLPEEVPSIRRLLGELNHD